MKRFMRWLCTRGYHRGDITMLFGGMTITECRTCDAAIFHRWRN